MGADLIKVQFLYGEMPPFVPVLPKLTTKYKINKFLGFKYKSKEYYIEWEFCTSGPYNSHAEASEIFELALMAYK